jgi:hypothetical protein
MPLGVDAQLGAVVEDWVLIAVQKASSINVRN